MGLTLGVVGDRNEGGGFVAADVIKAAIARNRKHVDIGALRRVLARLTMACKGNSAPASLLRARALRTRKFAHNCHDSAPYGGAMFVL